MPRIKDFFKNKIFKRKRKEFVPKKEREISLDQKRMPGYYESLRHEPKVKYEVLSDERGRKSIKEGMKKIVNEAKNRGIQIIIGFETSGRPTTRFLHYTWMRMNPNLSIPKTFFLEQVYSENLSPEKFREELKQKSPYLFKALTENPNAKIMLLDDMSHTGRILNSVKKLLTNSFKNIKEENITTAAMISAGDLSHKIDVEGTREIESSRTQRPWYSGYAGHEMAGVVKDSVITKKGPPSQKIAQLRKELKKLAFEE